MTNEEALLLALNGAKLAEGATIQPQNNKQAYLAYALGLITDVSQLPNPKTAEEALLREYCVNGGGTPLPALTNPASAADIRLSKEAINENGEAITGTCDIDGMETEIADTHVQNDRLESRLNGGAASTPITNASYLFYKGDRSEDTDDEDKALIASKNYTLVV